MARWFFPGQGWRAAVTADLRVGGAYRMGSLRSYVETGTGQPW